MVYLAIKELANTAEDVIMVTSSIMKDMQPNSEVIYRPNAIRALCRIIDVSVILAVFLAILTGPLAAIHGARCREILQSSNCRSHAVYILRSFGLLVSSLPSCQGCG